MEEFDSTHFEDFSVEMGDYEVVQTKKFERFLQMTTGGSITTIPLIKDSVLYFGCRNHLLYALDAVTGKELWRFKAYDQIGASAPLYYKGMVIFGAYDYNIYALDAKTGELVWKFETEGVLSACGCIHNDTAYFGSMDQNLYAVDASTGKLKWKFRTEGEISSTPTVWGDKLFLGSYDRNLYCIDPQSGDLIWKFETQGEVHNLSPFPVQKGVIYFGSFDNIIRAVRIEDKTLLWKVRVSSYGISAMGVISDGILYQGTRDGHFLAISLSGRILWRFITTQLIHIPVTHNDRIFFGSGDQNFYCLDKSGKEIWRFHTNGPIHIGPTVWNGKVHFGSWDCFLYALEVNDGSLAWKFRTDGEPSFLPPPFGAFEVRMKVPESEVEEQETKIYRLDMTEGGEAQQGSFYRRRVTYQMKTQYASKGKYQVDSDEEEF